MADNVLLQDNIVVSQDGVVKLADFGNTTLKTHTLNFTGTRDSSRFSVRWTVSKPIFSGEKSEPTLLQAPEILEGSNYSFAGDVYALGMVRETGNS